MDYERLWSPVVVDGTVKDPTIRRKAGEYEMMFHDAPIEVDPMVMENPTNIGIYAKFSNLRLSRF